MMMQLPASPMWGAAPGSPVAHMGSPGLGGGGAYGVEGGAGLSRLRGHKVVTPVQRPPLNEEARSSTSAAGSPLRTPPGKRWQQRQEQQVGCDAGGKIVVLGGGSPVASVGAWRQGNCCSR